MEAGGFGSGRDAPLVLADHSQAQAPAIGKALILYCRGERFPAERRLPYPATASLIRGRWK